MNYKINLIQSHQVSHLKVVLITGKEWDPEDGMGTSG
jgi:hypothetical protein